MTSIILSRLHVTESFNNSSANFTGFSTRIHPELNALADDPDNHEIYINRGVARGIIGKLDHAISDLSTAVELAPQEASAYEDRGSAFSSKGEFDLAIADFNKAIELSPGDGQIYINRGMTWTKTGNFNRALTWKNQGDLLQALSDAKQAFTLSPDEKRYQALVAALEGKN